MKRDMVYIRIATVLSVLLITFSMFRLWENSITLKERIRITTDALHMENEAEAKQHDDLQGHNQCSCGGGCCRS